MSGNFGLDDATSRDERARLARAQRVIAARYGQDAAVTRLTAWLVDNGYEDPAPQPEDGDDR